MIHSKPIGGEQGGIQFALTLLWIIYIHTNDRGMCKHIPIKSE